MNITDLPTIGQLTAADDATLAELAERLRTVTDARMTRGLITQVQAILATDAIVLEAIAAGAGDVVAVLLDTSEWDNGFFFTNYAIARFADGSQYEQLDLNEAGDAITELSGTYQPMGRDTTALITFTDGGTIDVDAYGHNLDAVLGDKAAA